MSKSPAELGTRTAAFADVPGHQPPPFGVRRVCRSIRHSLVFSRHHPSNGLPATGVSVSSRPHQGFVHAGRCARFAGGLVVLGFSMHSGSVAKRSLPINGVFFQEVDIWN